MAKSPERKITDDVFKDALEELCVARVEGNQGVTAIQTKTADNLIAGIKNLIEEADDLRAQLEIAKGEKSRSSGLVQLEQAENMALNLDYDYTVESLATTAYQLEYEKAGRVAAEENLAELKSILIKIGETANIIRLFELFKDEEIS